MKKNIFLPLILAGCLNCNAEIKTKGMELTDFQYLTSQQLFDTANYFFFKNSMDTAMLCYNQIINNTPANAGKNEQHKVIVAYNRTALVHYQASNYTTAYDLYLKALRLAEKFGDTSYESKIYTNIGAIYYQFHEYAAAKNYCLKAMKLSTDTNAIILLLSNIAASEFGQGNMDSTFHYFNKAMQLSMRHNNAYAYSIHSNIGAFYQERKQYDSAFHYLRMALKEARKSNQIIVETEILSTFSQLFFETGKIDSALYYIEHSNALAKQHNSLKYIAKNYLTLSKIEEKRGNKSQAFDYFRAHKNLEDSILNTQELLKITQLQHLYEISKTNEQMKLKERTIYWQRIGLIALLLLVAVLSNIFFQKRKLDKAYKALFEKNLEIIELQKNSNEKKSKKYKYSGLNQDMQTELLNKILSVMENSEIICDSEFSIDKLAELVNSNKTYVSQTINDVLKLKFRSFLNDYRIREAQRLFSEDPESSITSVSQKVGFKSRNAFFDAFKENTGVSPIFYINSLREQKFSA